MRFAVAVIVLGLAGCDGGNTIAPKHNTGDRLHLTDETWACNADAQEAADNQHDREAYIELMMRFYATRQCVPLDRGTIVDVINKALIRGRTEIRVKGHPEARWVISVVLDKQSDRIGRWDVTDATRR